MKYETLFIMVRVVVHADHANISEIVSEVETLSKLSLSDTPKVKILETEILMSRVRNIKNVNHSPLKE
jgi:hypothetical protein